jgi:hypothetical protein
MIPKYKCECHYNVRGRCVAGRCKNQVPAEKAATLPTKNPASNGWLDWMQITEKEN